MSALKATSEMKRAAPAVMAKIAREPGEYYQQTLAIELGISRPITARALRLLSWRHWLQEGDVIRQSGQSANPVWLKPSERFTDDFTQITQSVESGLRDKNRNRYVDALGACNQAHVLEDERDSEDATAAYLGRAVLLGEEVGLEDYGWYDGFSGWRGLLETHANFMRRGVIEPIGDMTVSNT